MADDEKKERPLGPDRPLLRDIGIDQELIDEIRKRDMPALPENIFTSQETGEEPRELHLMTKMEKARWQEALRASSERTSRSRIEATQAPHRDEVKNSASMPPWRRMVAPVVLLILAAAFLALMIAVR